ncbi:MAG: zinc-ribbon domain-containing protein [Bacillota bacterium]|nr:zinc-ribbon domain-containing protein [Bacillota bacterium]
MKRCPKCNEDNSDNAIECSSCGYLLNNAEKQNLGDKMNVDTFCPKCNERIKPGSRNCSNCGSFIAKTLIPKHLTGYENSVKWNKIGGGTKIIFYIITIIIPIVGIIIGVMSKISKSEERRDFGNSLFILGIAMCIVYYFLRFML